MKKLLKDLACPRPGCLGALKARHGGLLLDCTRCGAPYPVLGGVPILVPDPAAYLAQHRDAVLASLAEADAVTRNAVTLVDAFAAEAGPMEAQRFGDDWTAQDGHLTPVDPTFASWMQHAAQANLYDVMVAQLEGRPRSVLDLGCGDGGMAARLARQFARVVVADLSLRAVFVALRAARDGGGEADVSGVVMDAHALPLRGGAVDAVMAANVVDLLEDPLAFLLEAQRVVGQGRVVLSVPQPAGLDALIQHAAATLVANVDAVPWFRVHHDRHVQVYFPRVVGLQWGAVRKKALKKGPRRSA